ncbi:MAG TPA: TetR/AcrR family transcriptional regulator [Polyangiaceae bacterium]|nr:TetR/AcrR family transcriptional regulator [Polyangiaceae bacterium]
MASNPMKTRGRPRAIPRRAPGKRIVEAILHSAMTVLSRDGVQRLTTNRIAQHAGVSIGSVYQYFPDKHAIIAAIGRELEQRALRLFEQAVEHAPARSIAEVVGVLVRGLAHESFGELPVRREILRQVPRNWLTDASERVDSAVKAELAKLLAARADVREGDPELMAFVAMHAVEAVLEAAVLHRPDLLSDERFQRELVLLTVKYLQATPVEPGAAS